MLQTRLCRSAGLVGSLLMSLTWMFILRYSAGLLAWTVVVAANLLFIACTLLAFTKVWHLGTCPGLIAFVIILLVSSWLERAYS